jgi:hypothetical protein
LVYRETGDKRGIALALCSLGDAAQCRGDLARAFALYRDSLNLYRGVGDKWGMATCLKGLATTFLAHGQQPLRAARLFGAADGLRTSIGALLSPAEQKIYERSVALALEVLGETRFARAWEIGRAGTLDEVIAGALSSFEADAEDG